MQNKDFHFPKIPDLLRRLDVRLSPFKSQHFIHNYALVEMIAECAELTSEHSVVEAGAGLANLSTALANRAGKVVSVELDQAFKSWHEECQGEFPNLEILYQDFLDSDLEALASDWEKPVVVGNLPYQITAPILFKLLNANVNWERIVVVVQLEVAERIIAGPKNRRATALTYKLALDYESKITMRLGPQEFIPPPKVKSATLVLRPLSKVLYHDIEHRDRLHRLITGIFQYRRKTLTNALQLCGIVQDKGKGIEAIKSASLDPICRPETLDLEDIVRLEAALHD